MDVTILDSILRLVITLEFAFLAVTGLTTAVHLVMMDAEIRDLSSKQYEMYRGVKEGLELKIAEKEQKKSALLASLTNAA